MDLQPLDAPPPVSQQASKRQRLINFLVDALGYYCSILVLYLMGLADGIEWLFDSRWARAHDVGLVALYVSTTLLYCLYYTFFESYYKGKTPGKWLTQTRVVTQYGHPMDGPTAFKRNFLRYNPLDALSFLAGLNWHDRWSNTIVINERPATPSLSNTP